MMLGSSLLTPPRNLDGASSVAMDVKALGNLKQASKDDPDASLKAVAKQFESLFVDMMMKSMRDAAAVEDNGSDSRETKTFTTMLDQQRSVNLAAGKGIGLADMMVKQLSKTTIKPDAVPTTSATDGTLKPASSGAVGLKPLRGEAQPMLLKPTDKLGKTAGFTEKMWDHAKDAADKLGVSPQLVVAHAALESGWGKSEIKDAAGNNSYNLFGIKADKNWKGKVVEANTTEFIAGVAQKRVERFRAYDSYDHAFDDYAQLLSKDRYNGVINQGDNASGFANGLQKGGYATDPAYAEKIVRVAQSVAAQKSA